MVASIYKQVEEIDPRVRYRELRSSLKIRCPLILEAADRDLE